MLSLPTTPPDHYSWSGGVAGSPRCLVRCRRRRRRRVVEDVVRQWVEVAVVVAAGNAVLTAASRHAAAAAGSAASKKSSRLDVVVAVGVVRSHGPGDVVAGRAAGVAAVARRDVADDAAGTEPPACAVTSPLRLSILPADSSVYLAGTLPTSRAFDYRIHSSERSRNTIELQ